MEGKQKNHNEPMLLANTFQFLERLPSGKVENFVWVLKIRTALMLFAGDDFLNCLEPLGGIPRS